MLIQHLESEFIHIDDHKQMIEDIKFNFQMQKRIYSEKIKYFSSLLNEPTETQNLSYLSNFDNTLLNFTASSLIDKSVFLNSNQDNSFERKKATEVFIRLKKDDLYCSLIHKENIIVWNVNSFKPKFLKKNTQNQFVNIQIYKY